MKCLATYTNSNSMKSPPTRGAWIEIIPWMDRAAKTRSPPTRGAWIEISLDYQDWVGIGVAPHTGGVD